MVVVAKQSQPKRGISGVMLAGAVVSTDELRSYVAPLAASGALAYNRFNSKIAGNVEIGRVNALHSRMESLLAPFNEATTRRLPHYLAWFCWEERARRSDATRLGMLARQVANGITGLRARAMRDEPQPFFDEYWGVKFWADYLDDLYGPVFVSTVV